jgi:Calx-beta domain-containing protein
MKRRMIVVAVATGALLVPLLVGLGGLGYVASVEIGSAQADEYSTSTTTTTTTPTTTTTSTSTTTTTSTSTTTPTTTSTSTSTTTPTTTSTSTSRTRPTSTSTSTSTTRPTTTTTSTSTSTSTTTPTVTKPGKGCGDKNHLHGRRFECKVEISSVESKEGKSGASTFTFVVSLSGNPVAPVTVDYATAAGTASTPSDFQAVSGRLTFPVGVNVRTITVSVVGDKVRERNESFSVNLSNPSPNAYVGAPQGLGTIVNDD